MLPPSQWYCRKLAVWVFAGAIACGSAQAQGVFVVTEPWVRPSAANRATEAYVRLMSSSGATLIGASSEAAARVTLTSPTGKSITPMSLALPAMNVVALEAKGYRLALQKLARDLKQGDRVPMTLTVRNADGSEQAIAIDAEVRLHSPTDDHRLPHTHP